MGVGNVPPFLFLRHLAAVEVTAEYRDTLWPYPVRPAEEMPVKVDTIVAMLSRRIEETGPPLFPFLALATLAVQFLRDITLWTQQKPTLPLSQFRHEWHHFTPFL